jgi:hypothetical protein
LDCGLRLLIGFEDDGVQGEMRLKLVDPTRGLPLKDFRQSDSYSKRTPRLGGVSTSISSVPYLNERRR